MDGDAGAEGDGEDLDTIPHELWVPEHAAIKKPFSALLGQRYHKPESVPLLGGDTVGDRGRDPRCPQHFCQYALGFVVIKYWH